MQDCCFRPINLPRGWQKVLTRSLKKGMGNIELIPKQNESCFPFSKNIRNENDEGNVYGSIFVKTISKKQGLKNSLLGNAKNSLLCLKKCKHFKKPF